MNILIVDDEPPARERLKALLADIGGVAGITEAATGREALQRCFATRPDIVLLDIRMPDMDGIEFARHLLTQPEDQRLPAIIFTTAYGEHALAAFEAQAVDYLLKPIRRQRLQQALERATQVNRAQFQAVMQQQALPATRTHLCIRHGERFELIPVHEISHFHADRKYVSVWHHGHEYLIDESLKALEQEFAEQFIRIHRNALVARQSLSGLQKTVNGGLAAVVDGVDGVLEVSRRHAAAVRKLFRTRDRLRGDPPR
jgi:two-component system response regulator AlgR